MRVKNLEKMEKDGQDWWEFQFGRLDSDEDFNSALRILKSIPLQDRRYNPNKNGDRKHIWEVIAGKYDGRLSKAFSNFEDYKATIENQKSLF